MTSRQLAGWMAYYQVEPWGSDWEDLQFGDLKATVINMTPGRRGEARSASDERMNKPLVVMSEQEIWQQIQEHKR